MTAFPIGHTSSGIKMRVRHLRWLMILVMALFTLNGVAGVARACALSQAETQHSSANTSTAGADSHPCQDSFGGETCLAHGIQDAKASQQKVASDLPPLVFAPPYRVLRIPVPPVPGVPRMALTRPGFGESLTILFGNLRI